MKYGDWHKIGLEISGVDASRKKIEEAFLNASSKEFKVGIRTRILENDIEPKIEEGETAPKFTSQEYAEFVGVEKENGKTFIGINKGSMVRGHDVGRFSIEAEFGLHDTAFMGVWRRYIRDFEEKLITDLKGMA